MILNIQLTPEDYVKAIYLNMRPRPLFKWLGGFILLLLVFTLAVSGFRAVACHDDWVVPAVLVGVLAYLTFVFGLRLPARLKKIFRQQKSLHSPYQMEITEEFVFTKSVVGESKLTWDYFRKWKEGKTLITLYQSDVMLHIFPKRCFASPDDVAQFRQLLLAKLGPARG
jgi:hypothetical protein